jgi:spermidine/putrescine transport system ATP-binding protein
MKQRVALARALVNRPAVLLLDEPLGALDLKLRKAMQDELKQLQQRVGITFVYVTHDQEEALTMADRIAVMSAGRALQIGTPDAVYERPSSRFVADFIGETNFLEGTLEARHGDRGVVRLEGGAAVEAALRDPGALVGHPVAVAVRPEKIGLTVGGAAGPAGDGTVALPGEVVDVQYIGTDTRYRVRLRGAGAAPVVVRVQNRQAGYDAMWARGTEVVASWSRDHASVLA